MSTLVQIVLIASTLCVNAGSQTVQKRPDFSGTWIEDASQRKSPYDKQVQGGARALQASDVQTIITQSAEQITIELVWMARNRYVYHFDGRQDTNSNGAQTHTTRTRWEGNRLVTEGTTFQVTSAGEDSWRFKEVLWLTPKGEMTIETTRVRDDAPPATVLRVYHRKK